MQDHIKHKQSLIFIREVDLFGRVSIFLVKIITLSVPFDTGMKVMDYFFMPELAVFILPATVFIQPECGLILTDNDFFNLFGHMYAFTGLPAFGGAEGDQGSEFTVQGYPVSMTSNHLNG